MAAQRAVCEPPTEAPPCHRTPRARSRDVFGLQPLHKAVGHGNLKVAARLLADGGVDSNSRCVDSKARGLGVLYSLA